MRYTKIVFILAGIVLISFFAVSIGVAQENFSGAWILDKGKTHDLPPRLKNLTVAVTQNEQQIVISTKLEGTLPPMEVGLDQTPSDIGGSAGNPTGGGTPNNSRAAGGGYPGSSSDGGGFPSGRAGGGASPGGPAGDDFPRNGPPSGTIALSTVTPMATYPLDGKATTSQVQTPTPGTLTLKAKWSKDKKSLELSTYEETVFKGHRETFTSKERWTLSDGGQVLKVQRSVETPQGPDSIKLVFRKGTGEASTP
jgi:hypothetical protein